MKCEFIKQDGTKCEAHAIRGSKFCYFHNPDISDEEKQNAQIRGGQARALTISEPLPALPIKEPNDALLLIVDTISRVRAGTLDIRTANCLGFLTDKLLKAFEITHLQNKVEFIERIILERRKIK